MTCMFKVRKIRIYPNKTQERLIIKTLGACRWIYNQYLGYNKEQYALGNKFVSGYDFAKIVTRLKKTDERYAWLIGVPTKAIKDSIMNAESTFKRFFKGISSYPRFKSRKDKVNSYYFVNDSIHFDTGIKNRIKIPSLKSIRITRRNQLPDESKIVSGRVILDHGKYFVSFIYEMDRESKVINSSGIGIDLGIKNYLSISDKYDNYYYINNFIFDDKYQQYESKIKRIQQIISNKVNINYKRLEDEYTKVKGVPDDKTKNILKRRSYDTSAIRKLQNKLSSLHLKKANYSKDWVNKLVYKIAKTKPEYITIEDLHVKNMIANIKNSEDNRHKLHDYIQKSMFRYFRTRLEEKCYECNIELRIANRYFASSKKCSKCGHKKKDLTLDDRVYICDECGLIIDRDLNAAINLCNLKKYTVI